MRRSVLLIMVVFATLFVASAQKVTVHAVGQPAATVFRTLIEQTGKNFVYSSDVLEGVTVTVNATNRPLKKVLSEMFEGTGIEFKIKGNDVILKRSAKRPAPKPAKTNPTTAPTVVVPDIDATLLEEVVVVSRLEQPVVETSEIGAKKVTAEEVRNTPVMFGEADVIKALQLQPGVAEGNEGLAGMHVHGGNGDENLYMLDNVPLYQVNHFAGLFSAFNTDIIRYIDFFKTSMPAKYDGRLSSFMDVRLQNGNFDGHHGSFRLGLTSGAFNLSGPIGKKTTYVVGLRRSWFDVLTVPMLAIINSTEDYDTRFNYYFMDLNAKVTHRFSNRATAFASVYFGDDKLKTGSTDEIYDGGENSVEDEKFDFHWGNLVAQTGLNYRLNPQMSAEFTAAYTRFFSNMQHRDTYSSTVDGKRLLTDWRMRSDNNIDDWIFRGDFDWQPIDGSRVRFGANYVRHSFLPSRTSRISITETDRIETRDSTWAYGANELNAYIEDDWRISERLSANAGIHASLFCIEGKTKHGISPRLSVSYRPTENFAVKAAYSRTTQYVHQLSQTYLSLPTDQWIPITGKFKPQTADKIAIGGYWQSADKTWAASVEGYYKWMRHLLDYRDEYYLKPPLEMWNARLTQGSGTAKGIDFKVEKLYGKLTGHIAYSLAWADRKFADKNGGVAYPARFDNRHTIKILVNWNVSDRVQLNAAWIGHSGNRFTLLSQVWDSPTFDNWNYMGEAPLQAKINNYRLPFYHRLDLSCVVHNRHGYWTFSLYNAYCHMNTVAIRRNYKYVHEMTEYGYVGHSVPVFQKVKLLPIIPSISYTWQF